MDRVKALRRAAAAVVLVVACALVLSCSSDSRVVGSSKMLDDPGSIYGYVTGPYGAIEGANVRWVCDGDSAVLGSVNTDAYGYYDITSETWWSSHDGHNLSGIATKSGYQNGYNTIEDFDPGVGTQKDFYLEPDH